MQSKEFASKIESSTDGRYVLQGRIGQFNNMWRVYDNMKHINIALKRINIFQYEDVIETWKYLKIMKKFTKHPNIVSIFDLRAYFTSKCKEVYIFMELMDSSLDFILRNKTILTYDHIIYFIKQILEGLQSMHNSNYSSAINCITYINKFKLSFMFNRI